MEWYYWLLLVVLFVLFLQQTGRRRFWRMVAKHPDEAYEFFLTTNCWRVEDGINDASQPSRHEETWAGPFYLQVPSLGGKVVVLYGEQGRYEASQDLFLAIIGASTGNR